MSFTGLGTDRSSNDIGLEELGFNNEEIAGKQIVGVSATPGLGPEVVYAQVDAVGGHTYIAIKGANGAFSDKPYTLQVETSLPFNVPDVLNRGFTEPSVVDEGATTETIPEVEQPQGTDPLTLFVTQAERFDALYADPQDPSYRAFEDTILPELQVVCTKPTVRGEVISVASNIFDAWDTKPWDTDLANGVTEKIRLEIESYLADHPSIKYVVLVGSDDVIPQRGCRTRRCSATSGPMRTTLAEGEQPVARQHVRLDGADRRLLRRCASRSRTTGARCTSPTSPSRDWSRRRPRSPESSSSSSAAAECWPAAAQSSPARTS